MGLNINRIIIHYLNKEHRKTEASIDYSESNLPLNEFAEKLINELHTSISSSPSLKNAAFQENKTNSFTTNIDAYFNSSEDETFFEFSKSLETLKEKVEKESLAKGGYYLFSDYTVDGSRFVSVILLRKKSGINIIKEDEIFKLDSAENINIEKIAMAVRLNYNIYSKNSDNRNYLALVTTQADGEVSEYFKEWVLAEGIIKNSVNTDRFISILKTIDLPMDSDGKEIDRGVFKRQVFDFVKANKGSRANIYDISAHFYGDDSNSAIKDFADSNEIILDPEFKVSATKWKSLITIRVSVPGIKMDVDYNKIGENNVELTDDKIIIHSKDLATMIKNRYKDA